MCKKEEFDTGTFPLKNTFGSIVDAPCYLTVKDRKKKFGNANSVLVEVTPEQHQN